MTGQTHDGSIGLDERSFHAFCSNQRVWLKDRIAHPLTFGYWPECVGVDRTSRAELLELQARRLRLLMTHAMEHVPYYQSWARDNNYVAFDPPPLERWPITTKATLASMDAFQSNAFPVADMAQARTSGSSGEPFQLRVHHASTDYSYACLWRALRRNGLRPGDRRAYVWGRSYQFGATRSKIGATRVRHAVRNWFNNSLVLNAYDLTDDTVDAYIDEIERYRPVYLHGYVSALYVIARRMLDTNRQFGFSFQAVVTESETLFDFQKDIMNKAFKCQVLEHYGSVEFGNIAQADPHGRMRIAEDIYKLEVLPTQEVLVTNLLSLPYPLIRYKLGDMVEIEEPDAADALPYAILANVIGRTVDLIPVKAGGYVHGVALAHVIDAHLHHVKKYQIRQRALDHFDIMLACKDELPDAVSARIRQDMTALVGDEVTLHIKTVDDIPPSRSGKFRWVLTDLQIAPETLPATVSAPYSKP